MALIDRARNVYFDRARERWKQKGFDADITDILEDYRAETNKKIKRDKVNVLSTFLISLYDYDHDSLQLDITKLIVLSPSSEFPAKDKRKLLQILWSTIQMLYADDWSEVSLFVKLDVSKTLYFCCYISSCFDRGYLDQTKLSMASGSDRRCASLTA